MEQYSMSTDLLPHQLAAYEKLHNISVFALYMEPGLGKTRTTLEFVRYHLNAGRIDCVLWFCPCSVRNNLRLDIAYHTSGSIPYPIVVRGIESIASSDRLYIQCLKLVETHKVMLVVDESNMIKNPFAKRTIRITELSKRSKIKCILNGTPVSRNEADMYAQWYILDYRILGYSSYYSFAHNHIEYKTVRLPNGDKITTDQVARVLNTDYLVAKITPYTYQAKKSECLKLPDKKYDDYYCNMTPEQCELYEMTKDKFLDNVNEFKPETIYKLFTALQHVASGRIVTSPARKRMTTEELFSDLYENPRLMALIELVSSIGEEKAIIYTKYRSEARDIITLLTKEGKSVVEFTGRVPYKKRIKYLEDFRGDVQFMVSNKSCGAYGLNLQFCHNIIFYNNDFNYATREQSEDRVHRLGQTEEVHIYDIIMESSIDYFIVSNLKRKTDMVEEFKIELEKYKNMKTITEEDLKNIK